MLKQLRETRCNSSDLFLSGDPTNVQRIKARNKMQYLNIVFPNQLAQKLSDGWTHGDQAIQVVAQFLIYSTVTAN